METTAIRYDPASTSSPLPSLIDSCKQWNVASTGSAAPLTSYQDDGKEQQADGLDRHLMFVSSSRLSITGDPSLAKRSTSVNIDMSYVDSDDSGVGESTVSRSNQLNIPSEPEKLLVCNIYSILVHIVVL